MEHDLGPAGGAVDGQDLAIVTEELRVATEELAAQQQEISELLQRARTSQRAMSAVMGAVPVAVVTTDALGIIREANAHAAALVAVAPTQLLGKPLAAYTVQSDRRVLRELASRAARAGSASGRVQVSPRRGPAQVHDVAATRSSEPSDSSLTAVLTWVLVPAGLADGRPRQTRSGGEEEALAAMVELTHLPVRAGSSEQMLTRIAALATRAVPAAGWTSITIGDPMAPTSTATGSMEAQQGDGAQWQAGQGPSHQAYAERAPVTSADVRTDPRWPALAARLATTTPPSPITSVLAVPVVIAGQVAGVLNMYSAHAGALDGQDVLERAVVFVEAAGAVLAEGRRVSELQATAEQLTQAMAFRAGIEQAKGLIAGRLGCTVAEAFDVLASLSQHRNIKLRDLAALVVADLPTAPGGSGLPVLLEAAWRAHRHRTARSDATTAERRKADLEPLQP